MYVRTSIESIEQHWLHAPHKPRDRSTLEVAFLRYKHAQIEAHESDGLNHANMWCSHLQQQTYMTCRQQPTHQPARDHSTQNTMYDERPGVARGL